MRVGFLGSGPMTRALGTRLAAAGLTAGSLRVMLSKGGGTYRRKAGESALTITRLA